MRFNILLYLLFIPAVTAQVTPFPDGVYLSLEQLKRKTPAFNADINVIKRSSGDIIMNGGND